MDNFVYRGEDPSILAEPPKKRQGWYGNPEGHAAAGRKGGLKNSREHLSAIGKKGGSSVAQNREHMAAIGRKGGGKTSQNREHMAEIGRKGGKARAGYQKEREKEDNELNEAWVHA